ncbi:MAG: TIGR02680 family protein [Clostridium sp.]|nr:TIGR02680 family protein [Clostridium sp.]
MKNRYVINKLGLINFWYYDIEEFDLSDGNLLLRGSNGCGKSVTMQSFIPLLLDGNKSPERLDPFGTRARTIANYLLEEGDSEKTAYLYMEFKKGESYITLGMGLKALKNKPVQSWYFILSDGRRIGKDLMLYRNAGELIPLTKRQLQNELGEGNFYTESQKSYMEMVNKYLFGFDDIESYEELLNLLISIRSPKLSKDFKPTEIYKILTDSLKALSDEDLRPISDSMENMDSLNDTLDENRRAYKAASNIKYHYDKYNSIILLEKSRAFINSYNSLKEEIKNKDIKEKNQKNYNKEIENLAKELEDKESESKFAEETYEKLINRDEFKSRKELDEIKTRLEGNKKTKEQKTKMLEDKNSKRREFEINIKELSDEKDIILGKLKEIIKEIEELSEELNLQQCIGLFEEGAEKASLQDFEFCDDTIKKLEAKLKEGEKYFKEYDSQKEKLEDLVKELDGLNKKYEEEKNNMSRAEELFLTEKENYKVNIINLVKNNTLYILEDDEKLKLFQSVDVINDYSNIQECKNILQGYLNKRVNEKNAEINVENKVISGFNNEIESLKNEILELKNNKEIEPERSEEVKNNRNRLKRLGINFIPLYKALDYKEDISDEIKGYIEGSLINMGLLDALVIDEKDKEVAMSFEDNMEDKYIFSNPNLMSFNLSKLLSIDKSLKGNDLYNEIDNVLQSIFLEDTSSVYLNEKGYYKIGILAGKVSSNYSQKFIGEASRKRHREELILEKQGKIEEIKSVILKHENNIQCLKNDIDILNREYKALPHTESINEALKMLKSLENILKTLDNNIIEMNNKVFEKKSKLKDIKLKLIEKMKGFENINTLKLLEDALDAIAEYKEQLTNGKIALNNFNNKVSLLKNKEETLDGFLEDIDNLYYDINKLNRQISDYEIKKETLEEALSKVDIKEIEKEIDNCLRIRRENPEIIKKLSNELGEKEAKRNSLDDEINKLLNNIKQKETEFNIYKEIFEEEYNLEYVSKKEDGDIIKICEKLISDLSSDKEKNREFYSNSLTEAINKNSAELREYQNTEIILFLDDNMEKNKKWLKQRRDFRWKIHGKEVNLIVLLDEIKRNIEELELLISEEERKVFEEVLMNTISQKVKAKIYQSNNWVKKINELMNSMNTSSSLRLNLSWVPKKAEGEGQLDIAKLIEILERGDRNKDSDLKTLAKHFSEKVKEEIRKYEGTGEVRNYHSIIKDILDYRQWYEFKLYYIKNNERKKELTNNAFFQFSGGEKAMSMYIPLFSAIYARYEKGRKDCPRIISMDEAFAGVDENNIRDMFRLLKELDLDYILNSQILWGDYDTVDSLSICELIREENDDVVTVLRYLWNGKEKVLLDE